MNTRRMHPLVVATLIALILFSGVGIGVMTGFIPSSKAEKPDALVAESTTSKNAQQPALDTEPKTAAPITEEKKAGAAKPEAAKRHENVATHSTPRQATKDEHRTTTARRSEGVAGRTAADDDEVTRAPIKTASACVQCGTVDSINATEQEGQGSGIGAIGGGVLGAVLGHQVGKGGGKDLATIAGAAGGAYAGHQVEKRMKKTLSYAVTVKMEDGTFKTINTTAEPSVRVGEKVKIVEGNVVPR